MAVKLLILGAKGMLGRALSRVFGANQPTLWDIADIDIADEQLVEQKILNLQPQLIINAAAYTNVDGCEDNEDLARRVNGLAVGYLAKTAQKINAILVHYSTDYVFAGDDKQGYNESSKPKPINAYGRTKYRGEQELIKNTLSYYLIRTSWLYGPGGKNFVDTILQKAKEQNTLKVVNDQHGKPTYTFDLAQRTKEIIEKKMPFGIYHVTNETPTGGISWFDFATKAMQIKEINCQVIPCSSEQFPRKAARPAYSALINTKLSPVRDWHRALADYLNHESRIMN